MASWVKFDQFVEDRCHKVHDLETDQITVFLTNTQPTAATDTVIANITEVSYTFAGSRNCTTSSSGQTSGTYKLVLADLNIAASGGTVGPFRYVGLYNSTAAGGPLMGYYDRGVSETLQDGDSLDIDFDNVNGVFDGN